MNEWMNNSRQDDSDFMININAYNCCVCQCLSQRLWHVSKDGLLKDLTRPKRSRGPEAQVVEWAHHLNKSKSKRLWIWTNLGIALLRLAIPKMHQNTGNYIYHIQNFLGEDPPLPICTQCCTNKIGGILMYLCPGGELFLIHHCIYTIYDVTL